MKKRMKKVLAQLLSTTVMIGLLGGCGSSGGTDNSVSNSSGVIDSDQGGTVDTSEYVELKMYLLGDRTPDFDEVYGKINEILKEKLNCTVSVDFLSWGEHDTKYSLLFSAQEDFDLIFTASSWGHYEQTVALGGFYPLSEEFIQTYAPDIWEVVPEIAWDQAKIDGQIYMVPNYQHEFGQDVMAVRGDLMEKYGIEQITSWDELKEFYLACASDGMYTHAGPWYQYFQAQGLKNTGGAPNNGEIVLYNSHDPEDLSFTYILDWDGFTDYCKQMKEFADAGCWSKDVLNTTDERQTGLLSGRSACMAWNMGSCRGFAKQANDEHPEWNVTLVDPVSSQSKQVNSYINNGMAINNVSTHKERAMMALNEFYTNQEIQDLTRLGIEGKHWEAVGDNEYKELDETNYGVDSNCNWGWINNDLKRTEHIENRTAVDDTYDEMIESWENNIKPEHVYDGFNFDPTKVATQFAAVEAALGTYYAPLINGLVDDVDQSVAELKAALESAGIRDVLAEIESQAAAFVAEKQSN